MNNHGVQHNQNHFAGNHLQSDAERYLTQNQYKGKRVALIGYGVTGKACADYLMSIGSNVDIFDKTLDLATVESFVHTHKADINFFQISQSLDLVDYDYVVVSPGVNLNQVFIQNFIKVKPNNLLGEIELFCQAINALNEQKAANAESTIKIIAVTGSNGKSTVVDMLTKSLSACGIKTGLGGNFGTAALALIDSSYDVIVLELSSFQLESTTSLKADIACVLNVSADHLDRHGNLQRYADIKRTIYKQAENIIFNQDDTLTQPLKNHLVEGQVIELSNKLGVDDTSTAHQLVSYDGNTIFYQHRPFISQLELTEVNPMGNASDFQMFNIQVVLTCAHLLKVDLDIVKQSILHYRGLSHRFETVRNIVSPFTELKDKNQLITNNVASVKWINDSKATNPGAAVAAIRSLVNQKQSNSYILLIAGGDAKGADKNSTDMLTLASAIKECVGGLILIGKDAELFVSMHKKNYTVDTLEEAVDKAYQHILSMRFQLPTDIIILLSPACASLDMFDNYQQRGATFVEAVNKVGKQCSN